LSECFGCARIVDAEDHTGLDARLSDWIES
jgi:hypothetical protein